MNEVWRRVIVRRLVEEWPRTLLTLLGVGLGVAVFVAIRLASHSALASFGDTVDAVAGKANLEVSASSEGMDERLFPILRRAPGVQAAAPVIEVVARARRGGAPRVRAAHAADDWPETVMVLGLDVFSEAPFRRTRDTDLQRADALALLAPRAAFVTRSFAARQGLRAGDTLTVLASGRPEPLVVRHVLGGDELDQALGGSVVIVDIATAQDLFRRDGRIDRVDLLVSARDRDRVRDALRRRLPADLDVDLPRGRTRQVENMVKAFDLNLTALSFIALFVATSLIVNAVALSVLRWRRTIGVLRAVGVTRRGVVALFLGEGLLLGVAGGALGLLLGTWLARGALGLVGRTLTDLYMVRQVAALHPDPGVYAIGFGLAVVAAFLAALLPALEAARTPAGVTLRQGLWIEAQPLPLRRWTWGGAALLLAAAATAAWTVSAGRPAGGFVSAFLTLCGFVLLAPAFTLAGEALVEPAARRLGGVPGGLGARSLREAIARTSAAVAAVMVAVGMWVALDVMVRSFRRTVDTWVTQTIRGDLYVEPVGHRENLGVASLPDSFVARVRALPEVRAVDTFRGTRFLYGGRLAFAAGVDFDVQRDFGSLQFTRGRSRQVLAEAETRRGFLVSESFAHHHRTRIGDSLTLETPSGRVSRPVLGVYYDYSTDAGAVLMDRALFERLWRTHRVESLAVYAAAGVDVTRLRARVLAAAGPGLVLSATPNQELRARVLQVFDQTFQVTYALQAIAILVAILGVAGTLTALILQRGREIAVLRAVGATRGQVRGIVLVESGLIGLFGALLGCVAGLALAMILIHVINRQYFGWTIRVHLDPGVFLQAIPVLVASALAAGIGPARRAATRVAAEAMRMD
jgi:putative ABC transport system permease protein